MGDVSLEMLLLLYDKIESFQTSQDYFSKTTFAFMICTNFWRNLFFRRFLFSMLSLILCKMFGKVAS